MEYVQKLNSFWNNLLLVKTAPKVRDFVRECSKFCVLIYVTTPDFNELKQLAERGKIKIYFTKDVSGGNWDAIRMGFGGFEEEIPKAIKLFSKIWFQSLLNYSEEKNLPK